ncbi:hypothetical protein B0H34DRAFT_794922 [Crassisporium funariophilum]|nr:hypothetical protein B0H34DRAFT_794922 [Crassisporium funariophilum]
MGQGSKRRHGHDDSGDDGNNDVANPVNTTLGSSTSTSTSSTNPTTTIGNTPISSGSTSRLPNTPSPNPSVKPATQSGNISNTPSNAVSSSSPPPSTQTFQFNDPSNSTTCERLVLTWNYNGQNAVAMTLAVRDQGQMTQSTSEAQPPASTSLTLTTDVLSNADIYTWIAVDVTEGWYIATALDTATTLGIHAQSSPFFVTLGTNTSCLPSNSVDNPNNSSTQSPLPSSVSPGPLSFSQHAVGVGDIVGIALGVTAGVVFLIAAFVFPRLWRRELPTTKKKRPYLLY